MQVNTLAVRKYHFTLEAEENINLPAYKGSTFHGGFGHALMKISPTWYQYFFEPSIGKLGNMPKPFVLLPPLDEMQSYPKGHQFTCDLTLFGEAIQHHAIAQAAIEYLGLQMGLGYEQGKYKVIRVEQSQPIHQVELIQADKITLHLPTRLRLKHKDRLQRHSLEFDLLFTRLLGRLRTLTKSYNSDLTHIDDYHELLNKAKLIKVNNIKLKWDDWDRFSGSQNKWMKFGGLTGEVSYTGDLTPFMEYLQLGEWIHIGNKTSFGLGKYEIK